MHLDGIISSNWEYKKKNDKNEILAEYEELSEKYVKLTLKSDLKKNIEALKMSEEQGVQEDEVTNTGKYYKELNRASLEVSRTEKNSGMPGELKMYDK